MILDASLFKRDFFRSVEQKLKLEEASTRKSTETHAGTVFFVPRDPDL